MVKVIKVSAVEWLTLRRAHRHQAAETDNIAPSGSVFSILFHRDGPGTASASRETWCREKRADDQHQGQEVLRRRRRGGETRTR